MSRVTSHNRMVLRGRLNEFTEKEFKPKLLKLCKEVAQVLVSFIDNGFELPKGNMLYPVDTSNLHDATGVAVYCDGTMSAYIPTKRAEKTQRFGGKKFYGTDLLNKAVSSASSRFSKGIWIVLFSAVPYAVLINTKGSKIGRGQGFFSNLKEIMLNEVIMGLKPFAMLK